MDYVCRYESHTGFFALYRYLYQYTDKLSGSFFVKVVFYQRSEAMEHNADAETETRDRPRRMEGVGVLLLTVHGEDFVFATTCVVTSVACDVTRVT